MIHLLFLLASLGLVGLTQFVLVYILKQVQGWVIRRSLQLLTLALPFVTVTLFALTMLQLELASSTQHSTKNEELHQEWLLATVGFGLVILPPGLALLLNVVRMGWLYRRTIRQTWQAPPGLEELTLVKSNPNPNKSQKKVARPQIRLWVSPHSFAFNLPGLMPGARPLIVLSTQMVGQLKTEELQAVLWHEVAHLARHDFWLNWLAGWWCDAFFYLPAGHRVLGMMQEEQELACDERVMLQGGSEVALALADALLVVWEETLNRHEHWAEGKGAGKIGFRVPGLASESVAGMSLTEQRVDRLIEYVSTHTLPLEVAGATRKLKVGSLLGGSVGLWLVMLELLHLVMLPLGCAISLGML